MSRKGWYGRHKDTWKPLKCKMVEIDIGSKCDCENCENREVCDRPRLHRQVLGRLDKVVKMRKKT